MSAMMRYYPMARIVGGEEIEALLDERSVEANSARTCCLERRNN